MNKVEGIFAIERHGDTLEVAPVANMDELAFLQIESGGEAILELLNDPAVRNIVVDFGKTDYFGTTALGLFVRLWKKIRQRDGHMAFCNLSEHQKEILRVTMLDGLWPICGSKEEAIRQVRGLA
jgi:anti-anti-sigma factor